MKLIKANLLPFVFFLLCNISYCQQKTTYEKKESVEFNNSDYSKISKNIKTEFEKWLTKSEFEKQETFAKRINEQSKNAFDSICNSIVLTAISQTIKNENFYLEIGQYNAEEEFFKVKINVFNSQFDEVLNVKISDAKEFKENADNRSYNNPVIVISNSLKHWCFNNNELTPSIFDINISNSKNMSIDISKNLINPKPLNFNSKELNIKNENISDLNFDFKKYNERRKQSIKLDDNDQRIYNADNAIYNTAGIEVKPQFPGGIEKFHKYIDRNYQVPKVAGLKGKIFVSFIVEKDGSLTDIKVIRDIGYGTGEEAIRILNNCPLWTPGEQNGKKVRVLYSTPINIESIN